MIGGKQIDWLQIARTMMYTNALIWLFLSISSLVRLLSAPGEPLWVFVLIAAFMFSNSVLFLLSGWLLDKRQTASYILALAVLVVNIGLTFTDQIGLIDLLTLFFDLLILAILLWKRSWILPTASRQYPQEDGYGRA